MSELYLTILIPAYNEEKQLPESIQKIDQFCRSHINQPYEILVVDDGSTDKTASVVESIRAQLPSLRVHRYDTNRGKGHAIRCGMSLANGEFVLFTDADLSTPIEEVGRFLQRLEEGAPIVIATRKSAGANILRHQPLWRESMGKVFTWLSNTLLGLHFSDFTCGFKAFQSGAGKQIFSLQKIDRWAYDTEILFLANRLGYQVFEIPVRWVNSPDTKVRAFQDTITSFIALLQIRWNWFTGKYRKANNRESRRIPADV
jgi:dolichyl-phosphate beta-glucosyltransferase